ncbi:MAG: aminomethyltransferase family protein, partial [Pseudomonadota bacterium]
RDYNTLIVCGPTTRDLFEKMGVAADLSLGWLTHQPGKVAGKDVHLLRVSFAGELGWEIHASMEDTPAIYDAVLAAGATPFGMYALNSMRVEKGYRAWKGDLSTDYSLLEGGLDRFIKFDKPQDFPGKAALLAEKQQGVKKRFVTLELDHHDCDAPYMSPVSKDGKVVGEITSCAMGYRTDKIVALGMLVPELHNVGTEVTVNIFGDHVRAVVLADQPAWDPDNARIRA